MIKILIILIIIIIISSSSVGYSMASGKMPMKWCNKPDISELGKVNNRAVNKGR